MESDYALALKLQQEYDRENEYHTTEDDRSEHRVVDESLELIDPTPDIHALFREFDRIYFSSKLQNVEVRWSPRMTLCAGLCCYEGFGGLCSIRLSKPLLSLRPRKDLVQTLLHEMIHAFLFVTHNNKDHNAHGSEFQNHMNRINKLSGANITVYHSFHDEVNNFKTHWWKCNGPCKDQRPFYGMVKRSMNRAPGPNDTWWAEHVKKCNGTFVKIKGPTETKRNGKRKNVTSAKECKEGKSSVDPFVPFSGTGHTLNASKTLAPAKKKSSRTIDTYFSPNRRTTKEKKEADSLPAVHVIVNDTMETSSADVDLVTCPVCGSEVSSNVINGHLDNCLHLAS